MKTTIVTLHDDLGDFKAPPGSRPWALWIRSELHRSLKSACFASSQIIDFVEAMIQHQGYRQLTDRKGQPFLTYEAFCCEPWPFGLGYKAEDIERIVGERREMELAKLAKTVPPLGENGGDREGSGRKSKLQEDAQSVTPVQDHGSDRASGNQSYNVTLISRGNNNSYLLSRLKRDRTKNPKADEALAKIESGEFTSARQAAIHAGIVKVPTPLDIARKAWAKMSAEERATFLSEIQCSP